MLKKTLICAALALGAATSAHAADGSSPIRFLVGGGVTFGGDKLATVTYTDGRTADIRAGGLAQIYAGLDYRMGNDVSMQVTAGYHVDDTNADNGSLKFSRYPVELLAYYHATDQIRIGGGVRFVNNPKISSSGVISGNNVEFKNTTGIVIEGEYFFSPNFSMKLRGVKEDYTLKDTDYSVSGNHFGALFNYYF